MTKILVTGHEGVIASNLIKKLTNCEIVIDSINGKRIDLQNNEEVMKIEPENSNELLNQIICLIDDEEKLAKISKLALSQVQNYDWSNIGKKYLDLYKKLLNS